MSYEIKKGKLWQAPRTIKNIETLSLQDNNNRKASQHRKQKALQGKDGV